MGRPHWHPKNCKSCDASVADAGHISQTGLCPSCSEHAFIDNLLQLKAHRGPRFNYWRSRIAASVGGVLVDGLGEPD